MNYDRDVIEFWKKDDFKNITAGGKQFPEGWDVRTLIHELVGSEDIIEVGCGYGRLVEAFTPEQYTGVDINPTAVVEATNRNPQYTFREFSVDEELPSSTWLMFYTVLLHVPNDVIQEYLKSVTRNATKVLISEILGKSWADLWKYAFNRDEEEYDRLMENCGFVKTQSVEREYQHYNTTYKFLVYERSE